MDWILAGVFAFGGAHAVQDGGEDVFISHCSINHYVVQRPGGPVGAEIMLHKENALPVYGIDQIFRIFQAFAQALNSSKFFRARRVQKYVKSIVAVAQEIWSAAAHDHAVALLGNIAHYLFADLDHAVGTEWLVGKSCATLVASTPEDFN